MLVELRLLGPVELRCDGRAARLQPLQWGLLAALFMADGRSVSVDWLVRLLWADPPSGVRASLQTRASQLRRVLSETAGNAIRIQNQNDGYSLHHSGVWIDLAEFRRVLTQARAEVESNPETAARRIREAVALWRGDALQGLPPGIRSAYVAGLTDELARAYVDLADVEFARNQHREVVPTLAELVVRWPYDQQILARYATALHACGRTTEALKAIAAAESMLKEEQGIDLDSVVGRLRVDILRAATADATALPICPVAPRPPAILSGRDSDIEAITQALRRPRCGSGRCAEVIVAISGAPGVGKTAVTWAIADRLTNEFAGGQAYLDLAPAECPSTNHSLLGRALRRLGVTGVMPHDEQGREDLLSAIVADRRILLILDNLSDPAMVRSLLRCRWGGVLITSRTPLLTIDNVDHVTLGVLSWTSRSPCCAKLPPVMSMPILQEPLTSPGFATDCP